MLFLAWPGIGLSRRRLARHNGAHFRAQTFDEMLDIQRQRFFFSSRRRHTRLQGDWSSDVCSSDLIEANMRTEDLLKQSQSLARELQSQQEELQQTNLELEDKAKLLAEQNVEVERKNSEVEQARQALEEKAKQLAVTSKYKSEFMANMSHELRTPLNSLLILSDQLSKNGDGNLTGRQVEFAKTIHSSGNDLLMLINDILDLSKIESGTVVVDIGDVMFLELQDYFDRTFRHVAESKKLAFGVELGERLPRGLQRSEERRVGKECRSRWSPDH